MERGVAEALRRCQRRRGGDGRESEGEGGSCCSRACWDTLLTEDGRIDKISIDLVFRARARERLHEAPCSWQLLFVSTCS